MKLPLTSGPGPEEKIWSVAELTASVKGAIEEAFPPLWVEGEISNFVHHGSGHMYFSLKDEKAQLRAVFFRGDNHLLRFKPEDGMKVRARGSLTVYERSGQYQILVRRLQPVGTGELELAFRQLVDRLGKEGLFDESRKKPLPAYPDRIGVLTSATGAAIHDILRVLRRRFPVTVLLYPVRVQGEGAAEEIATAIERMNERGDVDLLVVGRGGGSLEDLWAFNEEIVARAIVASAIPVLSAVGHEVDVTISDLVADRRAATPSAAAEILAPSRDEVGEGLVASRIRMARTVRDRLRFFRERLRRIREGRALGRPGEMIRREAQRLDDLSGRLARSVGHGHDRARDRIARLRQTLTALDPKGVLERGYCICRDDAGRAVTDASRLVLGARVEIAFRRGGAGARIEEVYESAGEGGES